MIWPPPIMLPPVQPVFHYRFGACRLNNKCRRLCLWGRWIHITGTVILDGQGDPNAVFIFNAASTLTTAASSTVSLINGASACNVFWRVGSSAATLGANSVFKGNLLSDQSITLVTGANVEGRLLARIAAVTLDSNIVEYDCAATTLSATNVNNTITVLNKSSMIVAGQPLYWFPSF